MADERTVKLKLKTAHVEIDFEGGETFLRSEFLRLVTELSKLEELGPAIHNVDISGLASDFVRTLKERAYGTYGPKNADYHEDTEREGDYGTWDDWKSALVDFGMRVWVRADPNAPESPEAIGSV